MVTEELQKKRDHLEAYLKQLGSVVLAIAFLDELVLELRGQRVQPTSGEALRNE